MKEYDWLIVMIFLVIFGGGCVIGGVSVIIIQSLIKLAIS